MISDFYLKMSPNHPIQEAENAEPISDFAMERMKNMQELAAAVSFI